MQVKSLLQIILFSFTLCAINLVYANETKELEQHVATTLIEENLVGITWSIVSDNKHNSGSAGMADIAKQQPMGKSQNVRVGSVTKTVLAMGVLRLISEDKLTLDSEVTPYLPNLSFNNPWVNEAPIRIRHLLEHTAGLDNIKMRQLLNPTSTPSAPLNHAFSQNQKSLLTLRTKPGTHYAYSNMGYALLGMVIEKVTQQRYETYLDDHLLSVLEMHDSTFEFTSQSEQNTPHSLAMGYHENKVAQHSVPISLRPAEQFTTTAPDMAKFMAFVLGDGTIGDDVFIKADLMAMLAMPHNTDAKNAGLLMGHGLAFAVRDRHGAVGMCHPGQTFGFTAYICLYPKEKKGFFYSINTDDESADTERFNALFIQHLNLLPIPPLPSAHIDNQNKQIDGLYVLAPNGLAEFAFVDMLFHFMWVEHSQQHLVLNPLQSSAKHLTALGNNLYRQAGRTQASHVIYTNEKQEVFITNGLKTYKKVSITKLGLYWLSMLAGLLGLVSIFIVGVIKLFTPSRFSRPNWSFINLLLFTVPAYFFSEQSFIEFGLLNSASISLIVIATLLPMTLGYSLFYQLKQSQDNYREKMYTLALASALQFCVILIWWKQYPLIFWI
ncbi:methicillin resistance protein FmtA [Pseudoalteromonas citrea]|uniref:Methicillin resistance protein FmtA n=1 Tax=Pseudoalteromonas citrea TaxID=43655 RepID=A0A5S3XL14_9GAMM|nr:serine hydrolase domain-containing protein [Pseudoalteromonas citrea]TMP47142.1 methicillin resistance protein FmtA [Pseudoalteromonas citrea]TMP54097.1 methicillin resistance protein FmtA [Pseudoalteromonas citrea]